MVDQYVMYTCLDDGEMHVMQGLTARQILASVSRDEHEGLKVRSWMEHGGEEQYLGKDFSGRLFHVQIIGRGGWGV